MGGSGEEGIQALKKLFKKFTYFDVCIKKSYNFDPSKIHRDGSNALLIIKIPETHTHRMGICYFVDLCRQHH